MNEHLQEAIAALETIRTERLAARGLPDEASAVSRARVALDRATEQLATLATQAADARRLDWLLDFITQNGADGIANLQWTVVDPEEIMEDRTEVVFDRAAIDAAMPAGGEEDK